MNFFFFLPAHINSININFHTADRWRLSAHKKGFLGILKLQTKLILGWYRECNVISHTEDLDVIVFQNDWDEEWQKYIIEDKRINIIWVLGRVTTETSHSSPNASKHNFRHFLAK